MDGSDTFGLTCALWGAKGEREALSRVRGAQRYGPTPVHSLASPKHCVAAGALDGHTFADWSHPFGLSRCAVGFSCYAMSRLPALRASSEALDELDRRCQCIIVFIASVDAGWQHMNAPLAPAR